MAEEGFTTMQAEAMTVIVRQEISTAPSDHSIWTSVRDETTFRQAAVDLALTTGECPWDADIGLPPLPEAPHINDYIHVPQPQPERQENYILSEEIEHRLANDFALIAASREAVFSVTAACIEERADASGHLAGLKLWLAANEGVSVELKDSLTDIWACLSDYTSEADTLDKLFTKIVRLNRLRIYQRIRKAVGHPPIFREKGRTRTNPDDKLFRAFSRMLKSHTKGSSQRLTKRGHEFVRRGLALNVKLLDLLESLSVEEIEHGSDNVLRQLEDISKECFNVTTEGGKLSFKHLLVESGLDARIWLKSKYVGEVDKIGVYWRIARSLFRIHGHISRGRPQTLPSVTLEIEGVRPYVSVTKEPSIQGRPMPCYVHAEVQLITHLAQQEARADLSSSSTQAKFSPKPRIIGASKSACFLCFLFLNCYRGPKAPATHGRLYDQWTVPDLSEYTATQLERFRQTLRLMHSAMVRLREDYCLKKPRDHPMTSRVDIDRLSLFTVSSEPDTCPRGVGMESQNEAGFVDRASSEFTRCEVLKGPYSSNGASPGTENCPADIAKREARDSSAHNGQVHDLRALFEKLRAQFGI